MLQPVVVGFPLALLTQNLRLKGQTLDLSESSGKVRSIALEVMEQGHRSQRGWKQRLKGG